MFKIEADTLKKKLQKEAVDLTPEKITETQKEMPQLDTATLNRMSEKEFELVSSAIKKTQKSRNSYDINQSLVDGVPDIFRNMLFEGGVSGDLKLSSHKFYSEVAEQIKSALHEGTPPPFINLVVGTENMHFVKAFLQMALGSPYPDREDVTYLWTNPAGRILKSLESHCKTPIAYTPECKDASEAFGLRKMLFGSDLAVKKLTEDFASQLMTTAFSEELLSSHHESLREYKRDDENSYNTRMIKNYPTLTTAEVFQLELPDSEEDLQKFNAEISKDTKLKNYKNAIENIIAMSSSPLWFKLIPTTADHAAFLAKKGFWLTPEVNLENIQNQLVAEYGLEDPSQLFEKPVYSEDPEMANAIPAPIPGVVLVAPEAASDNMEKTAAGSFDIPAGQPAEQAAQQGEQKYVLKRKKVVPVGMTEGGVSILAPTTAEAAINYGRHLMPYISAFMKNAEAPVSDAQAVSNNLLFNGLLNDNSSIDDVAARDEEGNIYFPKTPEEWENAKLTRLTKCMPVDFTSSEVVQPVKDEPDQTMLRKNYADVLNEFERVTKSQRTAEEEITSGELVDTGDGRKLPSNMRKTVLLITKSPIATGEYNDQYNIKINPRYMFRLDILNNKVSEEFLKEKFFSEPSFALNYRSLKKGEETVIGKEEWENRDVRMVEELIDTCSMFTSLYDFMEAYSMAMASRDNKKMWGMKETPVLDVREFLAFMREKAMASGVAGAFDCKGMAKVANPLMYDKIAQREDTAQWLSEDFLKVLADIEYAPTEANLHAKMEALRTAKEVEENTYKFFGETLDKNMTGEEFYDTLEATLQKLNAQTGATGNDILTAEDLADKTKDAIIKEFGWNREKLISDIKGNMTNKLGRLIFLYGPAGTGKTDFSKSLAGVLGEEYSVMFLDVAAYMGEGLLGQAQAASRRFFDIIRKSHKTVFIIDEAESIFPPPSGGGPGGHEAYEERRSMWKKFLEEEFNKNIGPANDLYIVATTNHFSQVESATRDRFNSVYLGYDNSIVGLQLLSAKSITVATKGSREEGEVELEDNLSTSKNIYGFGRDDPHDQHIKSRHMVQAISWAFYQEANSEQPAPYSNREIVLWCLRWKEDSVAQRNEYKQQRLHWTDFSNAIADSILNTKKAERISRFKQIQINMEASGTKEEVEAGIRPEVPAHITPDSPDLVNKMNIPETLAEAQEFGRTQRTRDPQKVDVSIEDIVEKPEPAAVDDPLATQAPATPQEKATGDRTKALEPLVLPGAEPVQEERPRTSSKHNTDLYFDAIKSIVKK